MAAPNGISPAPPPPSRSDPATFDARAEAFVAWLERFVNEEWANIDPGEFFAVMSHPTDTTPGRLMRADYGYGPGNLLGAVTQAGGVPTGAVIERGENANGSYIRWADGTQICRHSIDLGDVTAVGVGSRAEPYLTVSSTWAYPATFSETPNVTGSAMPGGGGAYERMIALVIAAANSSFAGTINATRLSDSSSSQSITAHLIAIGRWF